MISALKAQLEFASAKDLSLALGVELQEESQNGFDTSKERQAYETILRSKLEQTEDFLSRAMAICMLAELELDRVGPKRKGPEFKDEEGLLSKEQSNWLLHSECYQVGLISSEDLNTMGEALKKCHEMLKPLGESSEMNIEDSAWRFMVFYTLIEMFEAREKRGDQRVVIAGNTGMKRSSRLKE